ncbi:MAG: hypothetical protein RLZZ364_1167 [Actinomycetota bacterium]
MIIQRVAVALILITFLAGSTIYEAQALPTREQNPVIGYKIDELPDGNQISSSQLRIIKNLNVTFRFMGTDCIIRSSIGCTVVRSSNPEFPRSYVFGAIVTNSNFSRESFLTFGKSCTWCSFAGDALGIVLFVVSAPASTPVIVLASTYAIGFGVILNHA